MNGPHDLGGAQGFGPIRPEAGEPLFHAEWERRAFALTLAMGATGTWTLDETRRARERMAPAAYLASSYYAIWIAGMERLLVEKRLVSAPELRAGRSGQPPAILPRKPAAADIPAVLARGAPTQREAATAPAFGVGDPVRTLNVQPQGHTRLPRYARGRTGRIALVHGVHVFPDSRAAGRGEDPDWLYSVAFSGAEIWGADTSADELRIDLWERYLGRPDGLATALCEVASIPREGDAPVFPAPWAARAFALAVALNARGLFTWSAFSAALGTKLAATSADAAPDAYWRCWLDALESVVSSYRLGSADELAHLQQAWRRAADATPHGQPVRLAP